MVSAGRRGAGARHGGFRTCGPYGSTVRGGLCPMVQDSIPAPGPGATGPEPGGPALRPSPGSLPSSAGTPPGSGSGDGPVPRAAVEPPRRQARCRVRAGIRGPQAGIDARRSSRERGRPAACALSAPRGYLFLGARASRPQAGRRPAIWQCGRDARVPGFAPAPGSGSAGSGWTIFPDGRFRESPEDRPARCRCRRRRTPSPASRTVRRGSTYRAAVAAGRRPRRRGSGGGNLHPGNEDVPPASVRGGLAVPFAGGTPAFPGSAVPGTFAALIRPNRVPPFPANQFRSVKRPRGPGGPLNDAGASG